MFASLLSAALSMVGCGKDESATPPVTPGAPTTPTAGPKLSGELNLFAWSEYVPTSVIEGFEQETGVKVKYEAYDSNEQMLAKLEGGSNKYDIIQPSEYVIESLIKRGALEAIELDKVPNLKNLSPEFLKQPHDMGLKYSVPWMAGTVGIVYNTEVVKEPINGFADVFQDKYKGKIVVLDDSREIVSWAVAVNGKQLNDLTPETMSATRPLLQKWLPLVAAYDSASPKDKLRSGEVDIGIVWSGEGATLLNEDNKKWAWALPKEGSHMFIDSLAIPKNSPNKEAALAFINYILRPEVSVKITEEFPYLNPNAEAVKMLPEAARTNIASFPPEAARKNLQTFKDLSSDLQSEADKLVTQVKGQ